MEPIRTFRARCAALPIENIDTDQITPASHLKMTDKAGLAQVLFARWRYNADGTPNPDFVLNQPQAQGAEVLVAGDNFGCGSSREHAPWAMVGYGFKAVVSTSIADIFKNNALKNGLLPIVVDAATHRQLLDLCAAGSPEVAIDLAAQTLTLPDGHAVTFPIDPFARHCLLNGVDELGFLLEAEQEIAAFEARQAAALGAA